MSAQTHEQSGGEIANSNLLGFKSIRQLNARREIPVELPEFLIVLLEQRVNEANDGATAEEMVTISHFVEFQIAEMLSIRDVAELDLEWPGFSAAVQEWLAIARE